jgi:predicted secreted Zn-dependent protease
VLRSRVNLNLVAGAACALSLLTPGVSRSAGGPGVNVERRAEYYEVNGATLAELKRALDARRARGEAWVGRTVTSVKVNIPPDGRGGCRLNDASVNLTLTVILPRLAPGVRLSPRDAEQWRLAESSVADHEEEHVQIAMDGAERVLRAVQSSRCSDWRRGADAEVQALKDRQIAFDVATDHGRRSADQGRAQMPPANNLNGYPVQWTVQDAE